MLTRIQFFIEDHLKAILIAAVLVLAFSLSSYAMYSNRISAIESSTDGSREKTAEDLAEDEADKRLDKEDIALRDDYDSVALDIVNILASSTWVSSNGVSSASFTDRTVTIDSGDKVPYVIIATQVDEAEKDKQKETVFTGVLRTPRQDALLELTMTTNTTKEGEQTVSYALTSSLFNDPYEVWGASERVSQIGISGPSDTWCQGIGTTYEKLEQALSDISLAQAPTAKNAEWDGIATFDYNEGVCKLVYTLDDIRQSKMSISIDLESGEITGRRV